MIDFRMRSKWGNYRNKRLTHPAGRLLLDSNPSALPWAIRLNAYHAPGRPVLDTSLYDFLFARRKAAVLRVADALLRLAFVRLPTPLFTVRRARGFIAATFLVNAF